jgi:hypothetical protein
VGEDQKSGREREREREERSEAKRSEAKRSEAKDEGKNKTEYPKR